MKQTLATLTAIATVLIAINAHAYTLTGQNGYSVSAFPNLFSGASITSGTTDINKRTPAGTVDLTASFGRLRRDDGGSNVNTGYMQFVATTPFTAGTVISYRGYEGQGTLGNAHIKLGGTEVQNLPDNTFNVVHSNPGPITTDTMRIEYPNGLGVYSPGMDVYISDINEVIVLEQTLGKVSPTATDWSPVFYTTPAAMVDDVINNGWMPSGTDSATPYNGVRYVELDTNLTAQGEKARLSGIILYLDTQAMPGGETLSLQQWTGSTWQTLATLSGAAASEIIPISLDTLVLTDSLRFDMGAGLQWRGIMEATLLFTTIPEPASISLLLFGSLALLRRRRA